MACWNLLVFSVCDAAAGVSAAGVLAAASKAVNSAMSAIVLAVPFIEPSGVPYANQHDMPVGYSGHRKGIEQSETSP